MDRQVEPPEDCQAGDEVEAENNHSPRSDDGEAKSDNTRIAKNIVATLLGKGIKVLALDFDKTIVSVHTAGFWKGGTPKLAEHVRPCFKALIQNTLDNCKLHLCIVTYSMQPALIQDVLKFVLPRRLVDMQYSHCLP